MISAQTQTDTSLTPQPARTALSGPSNRPETDSLPGSPNDSPTHSLVRDSLGQPGADSLASMPFGADSLLSADSLFMAGTAVPDSLAAEPAPLYRPATAKEVFGSYSIAAAPAPTFHSEPVRPLTGNPVFEGLVLLLAAAYAMLLYRHIGDIRLLLYRVSHDRASSERLMEDPGGNTLTRFLKISGIIGLLFIGIAAARYAETFIAPAMLPPLPPPAGTINSLKNRGVLIARTMQAIPQNTLMFIIIPTPSLQRAICTTTEKADWKNFIM